MSYAQSALTDLQDQLRAKRELQKRLDAIDQAHNTMRINLEVWLRNPTDEVGGRIEDALTAYAIAVRTVWESGQRLIGHGDWR